MNSQGYYRVLDGTVNNRAAGSEPLIVNCTGQCVMNIPFETVDMRHDYYVLYLCSGELTVWIDGREESLRAGQVILFACDKAYHYRNRLNGEVMYYWMHVTGTMAGDLLQRCGLLDHRPLNVGLHEELARGFQRLFAEFIRRETLFDQSAAVLAAQLCVAVGRFHAQHERRNSGEGNNRLQTSLQYVHRHYCENISVSALAAMEHLSLSQYRAVFKNATGISPRGYLTMLRMNRARELVLQTGLQVGETAEMLGYRDALYFSRVFKEYFGLPPREYRSAHDSR